VRKAELGVRQRLRRTDEDVYHEEFAVGLRVLLIILVPERGDGAGVEAARVLVVQGEGGLPRRARLHQLPHAIDERLVHGERPEVRLLGDDHGPPVRTGRCIALGRCSLCRVVHVHDRVDVRAHQRRQLRIADGREQQIALRGKVLELGLREGRRADLGLRRHLFWSGSEI